MKSVLYWVNISVKARHKLKTQKNSGDDDDNNKDGGDYDDNDYRFIIINTYCMGGVLVIKNHTDGGCYLPKSKAGWMTSFKI